MQIVNRRLTLDLETLLSPTKLEEACSSELSKTLERFKPIRFIVTETKDGSCTCELDVLVFESEDEAAYYANSGSIFDLRIRKIEHTSKFTSALLIPTGIGAELGGHCGDGNVAARLLASASDTLITHPNVVNASDLNEMTENTLYVEGGTITDFISGSVGLQKPRSNRILMVMDTSDDVFFNDEIVNAVSSARVTLGIDCDVIQMKEMIENKLNNTESGRAAAEVAHFERLLQLAAKYKDDYDAFGLATIAQIPEEESKRYFATDEISVNPWGGSEAIITHSLGNAFRKPAAHSPLSLSMGDLHIEYGMGIIDPRKAPESASVAYLHCILKGLHQSPRIVAPDQGVTLEDLSCLVVPEGCIGLPVLSCLHNEIPVIVVKNKNCMRNDLNALPFKRNKLFFAENYLEAAGIITAIKAGVAIDTLQRPINPTTVLESHA